MTSLFLYTSAIFAAVLITALTLPAVATPAKKGINSSTCQPVVKTDFNRENVKVHDILKRAERLYNDQDMDKALALTDEAMKIAPGSDELYSLRGNIYVACDQPQKAMTELNKALAINPRNLGALLNRGLTHMYFKDYKSAIADFTAKIGKPPPGKVFNGKHAAVWLWRAEAYERIGDYEHALADLSLVRRVPKHIFTGTKRRAILLTKMGRQKEAALDWSKVIELSPQDENAFKSRGDCYLAAGEVAKAINDYNESIALEPTFIAAYEARAGAFKKLGDSAKADADLKTVQRLKKQNKI